MTQIRLNFTKETRKLWNLIFVRRDKINFNLFFYQTTLKKGTRRILRQKCCSTHFCRIFRIASIAKWSTALQPNSVSISTPKLTGENWSSKLDMYSRHKYFLFCINWSRFRPRGPWIDTRRRTTFQSRIYSQRIDGNPMRMWTRDTHAPSISEKL